RCFRCRVCGLQLTLRTFHFDQENDPDVYCKNHVPKFVGTIDDQALGVRMALNAPKANHLEKYRGSVFNPGWQYEGGVLDSPNPRVKKSRTSLGTYQDYEKSGVFAAQSALETEQKREEDELYATLKRDKEKKLSHIERELEMEKEQSVQEMVDGYEHLKRHKDPATLEAETRKLEDHVQTKERGAYPADDGSAERGRQRKRLAPHREAQSGDAWNDRKAPLARREPRREHRDG
ncbi:hypothetical protein DPMN_013626, partial [Dreissena polymorpha]